MRRLVEQKVGSRYRHACRLWTYEPLGNAPAGSPVLRHCLQTAHARNPDELNWGDTGPQLLGEAVRRFHLDRFVAPPETFCTVHFFEARSILNGPVDLHDAYAVHLWHEMWRRNGWDKDGDHPQDCLYETLKQRFLGK